jgi:hypothetical protein
MAFWLHRGEGKSPLFNDRFVFPHTYYKKFHDLPKSTSRSFFLSFMCENRSRDTSLGIAAVLPVSFV